MQAEWLARTLPMGGIEEKQEYQLDYEETRRGWLV